MDISVTIEKVISPSNSVSQRITGKRGQDVTTVFVNGSSDGVILSVDNTWFYDLKLSGGENKIEVYGTDATSARGLSVFSSIVYLESENVRTAIRNIFDEYGLVLDTPRIPGEKNLYYKNRLSDYEIHPGGQTYIGLTNSIARALSMKVVDDAMTIEIGKSATGYDTIDRAIIWSNSKYIYVETSLNRIDAEIQFVDAAQTIRLNERANDDALVKITTISGNEIDKDLWKMDNSNQEITFEDRGIVGTQVKVSYLFTRLINLEGRTIQQVADEISALTDEDNNPLFSVTVNASLSSKQANHLSETIFEILSESETINFRWTNFRFFQLHEEDVWRSELNDDGTVFGTDLEDWIEFINKHASVTWENVKLDRDAWIEENQVNWNTFEPHIFDSKKGHWNCSDPSHNETFDIHGFKENGGICPVDGLPMVYNGILPIEFQSGIGNGTDLKVSVVETDF